MKVKTTLVHFPNESPLFLIMLFRTYALYYTLSYLIQNIKGKKENICSTLAHPQRIAVKIIYYGILVAFLFLC